MNAFELADQVEMWGEDLLALNMKGGIPVIEGAKLIRQQADRIADLETTVEFLKKALNDTLDALSSSIEFTKAIQERSRNERGL